MSETELSKSISTALEQLGCIPIRVHSGMVKVKRGMMRCAPIGTPDKLVMLPGGRTLWLEIKDKRGQLSIDQKLWFARAERMGHKVFVVRSVSEALEVAQEVMR